MLFTKKTTATVLAGFSRTLADLQEVEREHTAEAETRRIEAEQAQAAHQTALSEAAAARTVAGRIEALLATSGLAADDEGIGLAVDDGIGGAAPLRAVA